MYERLTLLGVVIAAAAPLALEGGLTTGAIGPGIIEEVAAVPHLVVSHNVRRGSGVHHARGNPAVSIGVGES
jgi:hypothetical protein